MDNETGVVADMLRVDSVAWSLIHVGKTEVA